MLVKTVITGERLQRIYCNVQQAEIAIQRDFAYAFTDPGAEKPHIQRQSAVYGDCKGNRQTQGADSRPCLTENKRISGRSKVP